jgi:ADP-ribosyl-[dinitrogen reductase] hydrolase
MSLATHQHPAGSSFATNADAVVGCLLGTATGDALGLPYEGLGPRRAHAMFPDPLRHHLLFGHGMVSDDTEHNLLMATSLYRSRGDVESFSSEFAWRLRFWFLGLPAGFGLATLRAIVKLWLGFSPHRSGVFSAGNGPAMRAALLGVVAQDDAHLVALVSASTRMTHTDPDALSGALLVAGAAQAKAQETLTAARLVQITQALLDKDTPKWHELVAAIGASVGAGETTSEFLKTHNLDNNGVSGYVLHTVPACLHAVLRNPNNFSEAIKEIIQCGGDADTTAAIVGGIVGARVGKGGIPTEALDSIAEWPLSMRRIERLGVALATGEAPPTFHLWMRLPRNVVFILIVLVHGFRRLLPPY